MEEQWVGRKPIWSFRGESCFYRAAGAAACGVSAYRFFRRRTRPRLNDGAALSMAAWITL